MSAQTIENRAVTRQVLEKALELVNAGDEGNYELAMKVVVQFVEGLRTPAAQFPPVAIPDAQNVRRYLVLEIRGGDEKTAKSWYGLAELELEHLTTFLDELLKELPARARKNPPIVLLHRPTEVEA